MLVWDIGRMWRGKYGDTTELTQGRPLPQLDGRFDVELFFGEEEDTMQSLARIPKAKLATRGRARSRGAGLLRVVFSENGRFSFSDAVEVCAGPNQWAGTEPAGLLPALPRERLKTLEGGPAPESTFLSYQPDLSKDRSNLPLNIVLRRVNLKPATNYFLSGWIRPREARSLQVSVQFYGSDGQLLDADQTLFSTANRAFWTCQSVRLRAGRRNGEGNSYGRIPEHAAFADFVIQLGESGFDLAAFSFVGAPEAEQEPEPEP